MDGIVREDLQTSEAATESREIRNVTGNEGDTILGLQIPNRQVFDLDELKNPERKRYREKMRRERVNTSYVLLKKALSQVDSQRYRGGSNDMSQEELLDSAAVVINELVEENIVAKRKIVELQISFENEQDLIQMQSDQLYQQIQEHESTEQQYINLSYVPIFVNPFENESFPSFLQTRQQSSPNSQLACSSPEPSKISRLAGTLPTLTHIQYSKLNDSHCSLPYHQKDSGTMDRPYY